ncbi:AAA family ATPase [Pseudomonas sp. TTU2014-080ASC]|uniref:AAA family ATPase n=1 Tax=Pseudomonas sp. TTU2014-080ASC TaxID=1729724 RepID=UPI0007184F9A|nr:AAA family ATPase [Pseudomonas sp. TTU2014-080ASC]KRW57819.1 OLD family endonuclease [Pseudomonas sp. TTU2014-080ASC]
MSVKTSKPCPSVSLSLSCIEISRFRRLAQTRVHIDQKTTVLVGANNSGKTSIFLAIRNFLSDSSSFGPFDISLDQWQKLRDLGEQWDALTEDPASDGSSIEQWQTQLDTLLGCMPTLDLWFDAKLGSYHLVSPFITSLSWDGGPVGIRLRLEPASSVEDLQRLAWRYREARDPVKEFDKAAQAWPVDLLDYWLRYPSDLGRVLIYKLDPLQGPLPNIAQTTPQPLPPGSTPIDRAKLSRLFRVDFVAAQRGFGAEEAESRSSTGTHRVGLFSNQLLKYARQHLNIATSGQGNQPELVKAIAEAQQDLDQRIKDALSTSIEEVKTLGYPGLHDPQEISFRTRIQTGDLLDHSTAVQYRLYDTSENMFLPEHSIGLGYQNLQSLSYQLVSFRESRLKPVEGAPAAVHLVMIEEPEAHLHVQVQRTFSHRAAELITPTADEYKHLSSQLIITTHASHLAHAENFDRLRYIRRVPTNSACGMHSSDVVSLADAFGEDRETRIFAERYFRVQHSDLLFADAAIFVEGTAERMLVPLFIEREFPELNKRYLSFLDIGGRHAHRLRPLVEKLGVPTVVITDIDPVQLTTSESGKPVRKAAPIDDPANLECGNDTLNEWHPGLKQLHLMSAPKEADLIWSSEKGGRVRFAWQLPVTDDGPWPSSFEDSLVLSNIGWFRGLAEESKTAKQGEEAVEKLSGPLAAVVKVVAANPDDKTLCNELHKLLRKNFKKGEFAATMFERASMDNSIVCPGYIAKALAWLDKEINPLKGAPK